MKLPTRGNIMRAVLVGALVSLSFVLAIIVQPAHTFKNSGVLSILQSVITPAPAEAIRMTCDPDTGSCGDPCAGAVDQCTTDANCAGKNAYPYCAFGAGRCGINICKCAPQTAGKTCGSDGCGGSIGLCPNGQTCSGAGNCVPQPDYCPRTDNPISDIGSAGSQITFVPSADAGGNNNVKITSASSYCPIGSVSQTPCSAYNNDQATCASEGCSFIAEVPAYCNPSADQVDCSQFGTASDCRNNPLGKGQCAWLPDGTGTGYPISPAAVGLAVGPGTTYSCQTKASYCSSSVQSTCLSDPTCLWMPKIPSSCYGTPAFKISNVVNIGQSSSKIYEKKKWQVPVWDYESCSFWRCTTKTGYDPHYLDDTCNVGQRCYWADGCFVKSCVLWQSAQVTATYQSSPKGWALTTGSAGGTFDPTLLNGCWASNPGGQFIPAPGCCVTGVSCPVNGTCSSPIAKNSCATGTFVDTADSGTQYLWNCVGTNGGTTANCAMDMPPPPPPVCNNNVLNSCTSGTSVDTPDSPTQYLWNCTNPVGDVANCAMNKIPVNGLCNNSIINSCTNGTFSDVADSPTQYLWKCLGINGGTDDNCAQNKAIDGVCGATNNSCTQGTWVDTADSPTQYNWNCNGINGGINQNCSAPIPPPGPVCAATHYNCASGTAINGYDAGSSWAWQCQGSSTISCSEMKPVDGVCSTVHYGCNTVPAATNPVDGPTSWTWKCPGQYGGRTASCTENKVPVDGVCSATHYSCVAGNTANNFFDGSTTYSWNCNGSNGGATANCSETIVPPPVNGVCGSTLVPRPTQVHYTCALGVSIGGYDAGDSWAWNCAGLNGGTTASCVEFKPYNGVCAATHYNCTTPNASTANVSGATRWTWTCPGGYGGLPTNCVEQKPPVITWTPSTATIDYHSKITYSYSTAGAVSCDYDELDGSGNVVGNIWTNGPTASPWSGPQGPYDKDVNRRLTCRGITGAVGVSEIHITVRQNNATCGTFTVPLYLTPNEHFTATAKMNNTGTNSWTTGASNYVLWRNDTLWSSDTMHLTNAPVAGGTEGHFLENLIAPAAENNYDFSWQMRPVFGGSWWPVFGPVCDLPANAFGDNGAGGGGKLHVKAATLALTPQNYQFSDTVIGDSPSTVKVHFQNLGGGTITGIKLNDLAAPFSCVSNCNLMLGPGAGADVTLAFDPIATGTASLNVPITNTNNSPTVPIVDTISGLPVDHIYIYGKGTDKFTVSTDDGGVNTVSLINFGDVPWTTAKYMNLTITNRSKENSGDVNPNVGLPSAYTCFSGCTSATLNPGRSKTVRVKFYPNLKTEHVYPGVFNVGSAPNIFVDITGRGVLPEFQTQEK